MLIKAAEPIPIENIIIKNKKHKASPPLILFLVHINSPKATIIDLAFPVIIAALNDIE